MTTLNPTNSTVWLTRDDFLALARHCALEADRTLVAELGREGLLPMLHTEHGRRYAPAHLWLLARYLEAVKVYHHPWGQAEVAVVNLEPLKEDARDLNEALAWWMVQAQTPGPVPETVLDVARRLSTYAQSHSPLGLLRGLLPMLRQSLREGLRGQALLTETLIDFAEQLLQSPTITAEPEVANPEELQELEERTYQTREMSPVHSQTFAVTVAQDNASREATEEEVTAVEDAPVEDAPVEDAPVEDAPVEDAPEEGALEEDTPSQEKSEAAQDRDASEGPALARAAKVVSSGSTPALKRPTRRASLDGFKSVKLGKGGGLKEALERAREAAQSRSMHSSGAVSSKPAKFATQDVDLPEASEEAAEATPEVDAAPHQDTAPETTQAPAQAPEEKTPAPGPSEKSKLSLEEQVRELNERRQEYMQKRQWAKLVTLYIDRIYLFPEPRERCQIYTNVGALYEHKLGQAEKAAGAYKQAFEALPGDRGAFDALARLYRRGKQWEQLLELVDWMLDVYSGKPEETELRIRRARLLGAHLDQSDEALMICRDLLASDLSEEHRTLALEALQRVAREGDTSGENLLSIATLLEAHWSEEEDSQELIDLYERIFEVLASRDPIHAAEVMSRLASVFQARDRYRDAYDALGRALSCNPERADIYTRLETLAERLGIQRELAELYEEEFERVLGEGQRTALARRQAALYEKMGDQQGLRRAWMTVSEADPFDEEALHKLAALQREGGQLDELLDTLERLREQLHGDEQTDILLQIAELRTVGLRDPEAPGADLVDVDAAFMALQDVLAQEEHGTPGADRALTLIRALIQKGSPTMAFQLAELMESFLARHDAHEEIVNLYEMLVAGHLEGAEGAVEAARLLLRVGQLHEGRLEQPQMALLYYAKALRQDPECEGGLDHLLSLGQTTGQWEEVTAVMEDVLDSNKLGHRAPWLRQLARITIDQLGDAKGACRWFEALRKEDPTDAEALDFLDQTYQAHRQWSSLADVLEARAEIEGAVAARKSYLERASTICLEHLGDETRARGLLRQVLTIEPDNMPLLERLIALYRGEERWDDLDEFLARQEELALDPEVRMTVMRERIRLLDEQLDKPGQALSVLERLEAISPAEEGLSELREKLHSAQGQTESAAQVLRERVKALEGQTRDAQADQELASALEKLLGLEESQGAPTSTTLPLAERLLSLRPEHLRALSVLEVAYEDAQDWRKLYAVLAQHADLMVQQQAPGAASVLQERVIEVARHHLHDNRLELVAYQNLHEMQDGLDLSALERCLELARQLQDWDACLWANEGFISLLKDPADHGAILQEMAALSMDKLQDRSLAVSYLLRAQDAQPQDRATVEQLVDHLRRLRDHARLAEALESMLSMEGGFTPEQTVTTHLELASIRERHLQNPRKALESLYEGAALIERFGEVIPVKLQDGIRRRLANVHQRLGQGARSLEQLELLLRSLSEQDIEGLPMARLCEEMGQLAGSLGQLEDAERFYLRALAEQDNFSEARLGLAMIYTQQENWQRALELLEPLAREIKKIDSAVEQGRVFSALGRAYKSTGRDEMSQTAYENALKYDPRNVEARDALG